MKLENQVILIVSNEGWGKTWYSKHNYAWELSKKNLIYFINPPLKFNPFNIFKKNIVELKITNNLYALTYKNILPVRFEFLRILNEKYVFKKIDNFLKRKKISHPIFWTFDPIRLSSPEILNPRKIILHLVDKYRFTHHAETIIAKKAQLLLCVAKDIAEGVSLLNNNVHIIPHVIASDEFLPILTENNSAKSGIYVGNIDKRMDFELTYYIVNKFPEVSFHFIGNIINNDFNSQLELFSGKYPNVVYHGEKPFKELKHWISKADFCFLFKDINYPGNNISSHKMLQYFAQGKPIFCTWLSKYEDHKHLLFMEKDKQKLTGLFENYIKYGDNAELVNERIAYAKLHNFETILKDIEMILSKEE